MGKDVDRNITRQLWERLKNTFTRNDVIPINNGGTGGNLDYFYPKLVSDEHIKDIKIKDMPLKPGFVLQPDSTAEFSFNKKSMFIEGRIHIIRNPNITDSEFLQFTVPGIHGYSINKIKISPYATSMSLNDNILYLRGYFNQENSYNNVLYAFIPFI